MSTTLIRIEETTEGVYDVFYYNNKWIGEFLQGDDGYYAYWPTTTGGCWEAHALRAVADKLDDMNKEWHQSIMDDPRI